MSTTPVLPAFDNTLGAMLLGTFASFFLYGITCLQTFIYNQRYGRSDSCALQTLVLALFSLDSFDMALTAHLAYHYLVTNFANPAAIAVPVWSVKVHVLVTSLSDFIVRTMFARRVFQLSHKNFFLTGGIVAISIVDLVVGTVITARAFGISTFSGLSAVQNLFYVNFSTNLAADLYVALVLSWFLWTSRTGFGRTDSVLMILIIYTVNTGMLTAIDAAAGMICYAVMPSNLVFLAFYLNLSKIYVNCYLASLNARASLLTTMKSGGENGVSIHLSRVSRSMPSFRQTISSMGRPVKDYGKEYGFGTGMETLDDAPTLTVDDSLKSDGKVTGGGANRPRSSASRKIRLGFDKDSAESFHDDEPDNVEIKVETTVHSDFEAGQRGGVEQVPLPQVRYGYPQAQTPDADVYGFDFRNGARQGQLRSPPPHPYAAVAPREGTAVGYGV